MPTIALGEPVLALNNLVALSRGEVRIKLGRDVRAQVKRSRAEVERCVAAGGVMYGINTGFGVLADKRIEDEQLAVLQQNLLLSHACGVGDPVPPEITRLMLQLKIHALGLGQSGISRSTFRQLLNFEKKGMTPWVPRCRLRG